MLNDAGPLVPKASLERIATYVGAQPNLPDFAAAEAFTRSTYAGFGPLERPKLAQVDRGHRSQMPAKTTAA